MRKVRVGLVQATWEGDVTDESAIEENIEKMIRKHEGFATIAKQQEVQILCFQELFYGPYFCAEQDRKWYKYAEPIPGPLTERMQKLAKDNNLILIAPMYEEESVGVYYNTAIIIDSDGTLHGNETSTHTPFGEGILNFDRLLPELNKNSFRHNWWTIDLCFWPDAWKVTESCKKALDKFNI